MNFICYIHIAYIGRCRSNRSSNKHYRCYPHDNKEAFCFGLDLLAISVFHAFVVFSFFLSTPCFLVEKSCNQGKPAFSGKAKKTKSYDDMFCVFMLLSIFCSLLLFSSFFSFCYGLFRFKLLPHSLLLPI